MMYLMILQYSPGDVCLLTGLVNMKVHYAGGIITIPEDFCPTIV